MMFTDETMLRLAKSLRPRRHESLSRHHAADLERLTPVGWMAGASCPSADPEAWQLEDGSRASAPVVRVCAMCPARSACLASAVLYGEDGVWAGTSQAARDRGRLDIVAGVPAETVVKGLLAEAEPEPTQRPGSVAVRDRPRKAARRDRLDEAPHGTATGYRAWGCRCDACREAVIAHQKAARARKREVAA
jgi:hypothetical protein